MMVGQLAASIIGVAIGKLFALNPHAHALPQVGGALACAITVAFMVITNTTHPPAGATALLAVTEAYEVGWYLVPMVLLGCVLILFVALLINNIQRRFPVYWWTPHSLARPKPEDAESVRHEKPSSVPSSVKPTVSEDSFSDASEKIIIKRGEVLMPDNLWISAEEREVLERVSQRIQ
jgi:CBS-domain-containing membrane protein